MNLLLVDPAEVVGGRVRLDDRRAEHLLRVLRVEPGRALRVGVLGGAVGLATVSAVSGGTVELAVDVGEGAAERPGVDLIVALPRPQVLHRVLQFAAAMGVGSLDLVAAWRVEKSFFQSPSLAPATIRRHLLLGAEQGQTTWLPEVRVWPRLRPFFDLLAAPSPASEDARWLTHPGAERAIEEARPADPAARMTIAIGPEGGWIDREVASFTGAGFVPVRLGPWVLRVEAALVAVLAQLELLRRTAGPSVLS